MTRSNPPLSGDVTQLFRMFSSSLAAMGNSFGFINLNFTRSKAPQVEEEILEKVASYGAQLGRIGDALTVLLTHFNPQTPLKDEEQAALQSLRVMLNEIAEVKEAHDRPALRLSPELDFGPKEPPAPPPPVREGRAARRARVAALQAQAAAS